MSAPQWAAIAALLALALVAIPAAALGWAAGRWALRRALDPSRLPALLADPDVRLVVDGDTLPIAGRFPVEPGLVRSELAAGQDATAAAIAAYGEATAREIAEMLAVADRRVPWL